MAPVLHVQMLGGFGLEADGRSLPPLPSRAASSLLAFLVLNRDRPQTRDFLAGRFWSDLSEDKARRRLSNALWRIRSTIGPELKGVEILDTSKTALRMNPNVDVRVDVEAFEGRLDELDRRRRVDPRSVAIEDLTSVVDDYPGDLLAGYYDDWIEGPRKRIGDRYLGAVVQLVRMNSRVADYETALRHARTLVAAEPLSDERQRDLIRLFALNGQPTAAQQHFERYAVALKLEVGARPGHEIIELVDRIRRDSEASPPTVVSAEDGESIAFVGRDKERSLLLGRVNDLLDGRGGVVLVEGEPGIGKSRLMEEVAAGAEWRDVQVMVGTHSATSPLTPFGGLKEALDPMVRGLRGERLATQLASVWLRQASTVLPELSALARGLDDPALRPQEQPWRTAEALAQVLLAQAKPRPAILILEDVHWCDEETVQVLQQLGDRLATSGLLICITYQRLKAQKSEPLWRALGDLEARPGSTRVILGALPHDEIRTMVANELGPGRVSEPALAQLGKTSAGNPYVILELLRSAADILDEDFFSSAGSVDGSGSVVPWLKGVLSQRIDSTSDEVRRVLEGVATFGSPATSDVMARISDVPRESAIDALANAVSLGFLSESAKGCEFVQEQSRLLIYDAIDPQRRRVLHGRIVDALVGDEDVRVEQLAYHAGRAQQWPRAYQYHSLAAEAALRVNAFQTAAEHFSMADDAALAAGMEDIDRTDDLLAAERVLEILGRREMQESLLDRLNIRDPASVMATVADERRAWLLANTDRHGTASALAEAAVVKARAAGHNVGELLTVMGVSRTWSGDLAGAIEPLTQAVAELDDGGLSSVSAELMLGRTLLILGDPVGARRHLDHAYHEAKNENDARSQVEALGHLATLHHSEQNEVQAEAAFLEALHLAVEIGYRHGEGLNLVNLVAYYSRLGRGGKALTLIESAEEVFASLGNGRGVAFVKLNGSELLHWLLGDDDKAAAQAEEAAIYFRSVKDTRHEATCLLTLANIDLRMGRRRLARRRLDAARQQTIMGDDPATMVQIQLTAALVHLELEHLDEAFDDIESAQALRREHDLESFAAALVVVEGRIKAAQGLQAEAVELANSAIALNRSGAYRSYLVAWWCAEVLASAGHEKGAQDQVVLAHTLLSRNLEDLPEALVAQAWSGVAEHRLIAAAREQYFVEEVEWRLPHLDAPRGKPLESGDFVDVVWTVSHPDDWQHHGASSRRQQRVVRLAQQAREQGARARIVDLAEILGVSERTIKRDLAEIRDTRHGSAEIQDFPQLDLGP